MKRRLVSDQGVRVLGTSAGQLILEVRNGALVDSIGGTVFLARGADHLRARGGQVDLRVTRSGAGIALRREAPDERAIEYERVDRPPMTAALAMTYAGSYRSPELGSILPRRAW